MHKAKTFGARFWVPVVLTLSACGNPDLIDNLIDRVKSGGGGPTEPCKRDGGDCPQVIEVGEGAACGGFTLPPAHVCKKGLVCMQKPGMCNVADLPGVCEATPQACTREYAPVCGCDGKTYGNDCARRVALIPLDHTGACVPPDGGPEGAMCGGIAGLRCAEGLFCEPEPGTCKVADVAGVCLLRPELCALIYNPVCGCDGKTYGNDCQRQSAGIAKDHDGACIE